MLRCVSAIVVAALVSGAGACGPAPLARAGDIVVIDAHAFPSIDGSLAAFLTLQNRARVADTVLGFGAAVAGHVMLHRNEATGDMIQMVHHGELELPPGERVEMRSGELHLMLEGLERELHRGDSFRVTLHLSRERLLDVMVPVEGFGERNRD